MLNLAFIYQFSYWIASFPPKVTEKGFIFPEA